MWTSTPVSWVWLTKGKGYYLPANRIVNRNMVITLQDLLRSSYTMLRFELTVLKKKHIPYRMQAIFLLISGSQPSSQPLDTAQYWLLPASKKQGATRKTMTRCKVLSNVLSQSYPTNSTSSCTWSSWSHLPVLFQAAHAWLNRSRLESVMYYSIVCQNSS